MVPNHIGQSPAPQWEILQDHEATDSSEVEDGRYDVPPHRMAPNLSLKRKDGDRPTQTNSVKRPRVEQSIRSATQAGEAGPSRMMGAAGAAGATAASAARATDSPDAGAELLQYAKSIPLASKPRRVMDLGRASISVPVAASSGSTSATQPPPARPTQPQIQKQLPPRQRPRLSHVVPNSMKSASHAPPPTNTEIIDISSGDEGPAPAVQPIKKKKRLVLNNTFKKRLGKPESASAPVKVKTKFPPEVIEILDSDEEAEIGTKASAKESTSGGASASASANPSASTSATASTVAKGKTRVAESSDASMASGTDVPAPPRQTRTMTSAKGKERAVSSDADSDASMDYAPASSPTSRPSSRTDVQPPPSSLRPRTPVRVPATAPASTSASVPPSPARMAVSVSKIEPATPQRRSSASESAFLSRPVSTAVSPSGPASTSASASGSAATSVSNPGSTFSPKATSISASAFASATASTSAAAPESSQYTPKRTTSGAIRAGVDVGAGSQQQHSQAGQSSQQSRQTQEGHQQPRQKQIQLAAKSTSFTRPPPVTHKTVPAPVAASGPESESEEDSVSGSGSRSQSHSSSRSHNNRHGAGSRRFLSHSGSHSAQTTSERELEPDTRGLSDALGLTQHREAQVASHSNSDTSSRNKGKGKEKEIMRPPLPGRGSTHSRTASGSSAVLRAITAAGLANPSVSNVNPVASLSSVVASKARGGTGASTSTSTLTSPRLPHVHKLPHASKPPKERKAAALGDSDEALPEESEGLSSDAGYETVMRGSQFIVNKLAQLRKERSAAAIPVASSPEKVDTPAKQPPRVVSPETQVQPSASLPPVSPTPPLQASSTSTPAERSPLSAPVMPRPLLVEVRPQSAPSLAPVARSAGTSANTLMARPSTLTRTEGHRAPLPGKRQRPLSISSISQHSHAATTPTATHQRTSHVSSGMKIRSPGNKPIWPPPPPSEGDSTPEAASPTDQEPAAIPEVPKVSNDVHMITDDEEETAHTTADEASESDGGGLFGANQNEDVEQSEGEELWEIEQVQQEVAEMSQSLAAASLSGPASMEELDEEIPEDRGEGPSRRITRSSSSSSGMHEQMPVTPTSDENENALVETASNGYAVSSEDLAASASRPQGKTYGGFPVLTWKEYRKDLRNFTPECLYAADIPRALHDHINRLTPHTRLLPGMRAVYEAMIQENTAADEPDAPPVRIENPVDEEPTPAWEFYYTNKIYHGAGVPPPDIQSLVSCGCRGPCNPKSSTCACVKRQREAHGNLIKTNFAYDKSGNLVHPGYPIYECNDLCGCGDECMNRVVQHGRKVGVAIRKTPNKGWGIFATQRIAPGQFIGIYSGELLTDHEAHERGIKYNKWGKTYLFDIDFHHLKDPNDQDWTSKFTVDAYHCGNFTRFLNHSCDPNSRLYPCYINEGNIQKPLLAIFSRRAIDADEEICFNYQGSYPGDDDDDEDEELMTEREAKDRDLIYEKCMCGAKNCTGVMFK